MYLDKNLEKKWLIKSESRILGPYSFDQIIELLRKKQISIIDEIRDPETRWLYVRENKDFKNVVEEIRKEQDSKQESTKTFQNTSGSYTNPVSKETVTNATIPGSLDDILQKAKIEHVENEDTNTNFDTKELEIVKETFTGPSEPAPVIKLEKAKIYGVETDAVVQQKITSYTNRLRIGLAALLVVVFSSVGMYIYYQKQSVIKKEEELMGQVARYKYRGLYKKAAEAYAALPLANKRTVLPKILDIYPHLESIGAVNMDQINDLDDNINLSSQQNSLIQTIKFWQAAKAKNYGLANDALVKAFQKDSASLIVKENQAWLALQNKEYKAAYAAFKALTDDAGEGRHLLGKFLCSQNISDSEESQLIQKELLSEIDKYTLVKYDLKKELLLAQMFMALRSNNEGLFKLTLNQFFLTVPLMAEFFYRPPLLFPGVASWKDLDPIRSAVVSQLSNDEAILFETHNLLEQNQLAQASKFVEEQLAKVSDVKIKSQLRLLILYSQGRYKEALALKSVKELDLKNPLNNFMLARSHIKINPQSNIEEYLNSLSAVEDKFYKNWLIVEDLTRKNRINEARNYISANMVTLENFIPVAEAYLVEN